jgi:type I restriction enzyme S subunit
LGGEWSTAPLDSLVDQIFDRRGVTVRKLRSEFVLAGHRVISAKLIKSGRIDLHADEARFVDEATYKRWMRTPLLADDVILTSEAPLGEVAYLGAANDWVLGQRLFAIRTDKRRLHGRFLYYALQSEPMIHGLQSRATGTTAQGIRQSELRRVKVPLPPLAEQRRIAHILGTLDDKIELNRGTNETLDSIARALFKCWFVDFDPVRAKSQGRDTGLPHYLAGLFPNSFEDSAVGKIPAGWRVGKLRDVAELLRESKDPQESPQAIFDHYSIPAFDGGRRPIAEPGGRIKSIKFQVPADAVLVSKLNPEIERVWLVDAEPAHRSVCSTECHEEGPPW